MQCSACIGIGVKYPIVNGQECPERTRAGRMCGNPGIAPCPRCGQMLCGVHGYKKRGVNCTNHPWFYERNKNSAKG